MSENQYFAKGGIFGYFTHTRSAVCRGVVVGRGGVVERVVERVVKG